LNSSVMLLESLHYQQDGGEQPPEVIAPVLRKFVPD
jgi:hypothetical protein